MAAKRAGPWDATAEDSLEIRMTAPRSSLPIRGKYLLIAAGIAAVLVSLRFVAIGAWPVLIFSVLDIGALAVALHLFNRSPVSEERLNIRDGQIELVRFDGRGRQTQVTLPAFWTRLEKTGRSEIDCDLWLVFRRERHRIGQFVSSAERLRLAPRIAAALQAART
ncbi:DUF2244 domain-containing protein [Sphingobium sp. UBA5915]|uniref:DUF2244 domain-containing protein n=1 Tax=Sphingobium sp. UBA5915 TaxID=1947530 RepID=UPI0039C908D0